MNHQSPLVDENPTPAKLPTPDADGLAALLLVAPKYHSPWWNVAIVGFVVTLLVLVWGCVLGYFNTRRMAENNRLVVHTRDVAVQLELLLSTLKDAETGQRGYLLTEDEAYLRPYENSVGEVEADLERLKQLTAGVARHEAPLAALDSNVAEKLDELRQTIELMKRGDRAAALAIVRSDSGRLLMEDVRNTIATMQHTNRDLLQARTLQSENSYRTAVRSILLTAIAGVVLVVAVFYLVQKNDRQRQRAAAVVAEQRERLRITLASIGDAVICTDAQGCVTFVNAVGESMTGWTNADAIGQPLTRVFHIVNETSREEVENPALKALRDGAIQGLANHTVLIAKDGSERPIDDSAAPIRDQRGNIAGSVLVFRDITQRRRAELANEAQARLLRLSADVGSALTVSSSDLPEMLRACVESMVHNLDAAFARIWILNAKEDVLELQASAGMYTHIDGTHARIPVGQFKIGLIAAERKPHLTNAVIGDDRVPEQAWAKREGLVAFAGYPLIVDDRIVGVVAMFARHWLNENTLTAMSTFATEVALAVRNWQSAHTQRQSLMALQESEQRRKLALDAAELGTWHIDPATNTLTTDERFQLIFRGSAGPMDYEQAFALIHPDDRERVGAAVAAGMQPEQPLPYAEEYRVVHPLSANVRWVFAKGRANFDEADPQRRLVSFDGTVADITERKRMEDELRKLAADLSESDRRKTEFLATLGHELRNPLAPIRSGLEVMKLAQGNPETLEEVRVMMERQVQQMVRLTDDLLDVSRITRGKMALKKCRVTLSDVLQSAVEATAPLIEEAGHQFTLNLPDRPIQLNADPNRLAQLFSNLLNNATKYTPDGGNISLSVEREGSDVIASVKDDGLGIPTERQKDIFEMFTQIDRPLEKGHTGLGIGLTLVKRLVKMHGGRIEVRSPGQNMGSEFRVRLPILIAANLPQPTPAEPIAFTEKLRILVVDDNEAAATMLKMVVKMLGNDVETAHDGEQAIEVAARFLPDVILMDLGMPKMNGYEAARHIRQQTWGQSIVLVALTGWGQDEDRQRTADAGFDHHLVKPAEPADLQQLFADIGDKKLEKLRTGEP